MYSNFQLPVIFKPTRETVTTATLINSIFTNKWNINDNILQGIFASDISDPDIEEYHLIRLVNETRMMIYKERISDTDWSVLDFYDNCESNFSSFVNIFKCIYNESFPVIKTKKKYRNRLPWLTTCLKESIKRKNKLYRISLKHPNTYNNTLYREYRNKLNTLLKIEEKGFINLWFWQIKNLGNTPEVNNKSKCTKLSEFLHSGSILNYKKSIANAFNAYFVNIGPTLASNIPNLGINYRSFMPQQDDLSFFLSVIQK